MIFNATPDADGSRRRYFLRVPPHMRTAHQGVAWTFGFDNPNHYTVATET